MPYEPDETDEQLLAALVDGARTPGWLLENLDLPMSTRSAVQQRLKLLSAAGKVENVGKGIYELADGVDAPAEYEYREKALAAKGHECTVCGESENLIVHHRDGNRENNELENLVVLCEQHHTDVHAKRENVADLVRDLGYEPQSEERTTIEVSKETWRRLNKRKSPGDTMNDILRRVLDENGNDEDKSTAEVKPDEPTRTDTTTTVEIDTDELPQRFDPDDVREVVAAALKVVDDQDGAKFSTIADELLPEHDLGYDESARNRDGAWWKRVVQPSMKKNGVEHQGGGVWVHE